MVISVIWDEEEGVWVATTDDVRGLALESDSLDVLIKKVKAAIPELMSFNNIPTHRSVTINLKCEL